MTTKEETTMLILSGNGYSLTISESALAAKSDLLKHAALIVAVSDPISSEAASHQIKKLGQMRILTERSRNEVKAPVLAVGKRIDNLAADFQTEISAEEARLKKLQGDYAAAVLAERNRMLREMEAKRREEEAARRKAEQERLEAERKADEARRKAEEEAFNATTPEEDAAAEAAALKAEELEKARLAAGKAEEERLAAIAAPAPAFIPEAPKGVKMVADFEVTSIDALYAYSANLVSMEARRREILDHIAQLTKGDDLPDIPGLRVFLKPSVR